MAEILPDIEMYPVGGPTAGIIPDQYNWFDTQIAAAVRQGDGYPKGVTVVGLTEQLHATLQTWMYTKKALEYVLESIVEYMNRPESRYLDYLKDVRFDRAEDLPAFKELQGYVYMPFWFDTKPPCNGVNVECDRWAKNRVNSEKRVLGFWKTNADVEAFIKDPDSSPPVAVIDPRDYYAFTLEKSWNLRALVLIDWTPDDGERYPKVILFLSARPYIPPTTKKRKFGRIALFVAAAVVLAVVMTNPQIGGKVVKAIGKPGSKLLKSAVPEGSVEKVFGKEAVKELAQIGFPMLVSTVVPQPPSPGMPSTPSPTPAPTPGPVTTAPSKSYAGSSGIIIAGVVAGLVVLLLGGAQSGGTAGK
jgi:hypothetical protein